MDFVLVLAAFWLPGLLFGAAIRLRGWTLAAAAPALTFGLVAVGIYVLGKSNIDWALLNVALWVIAVSVVAAAVSLLLARRKPAGEVGVNRAAKEAPRRSVREHLLIGGGVAVGLAVGTVTYLRGVGGLNSVHQDWDAPFHANLVRWIAEHHSALPSTTGAIANSAEDPGYFYPDVYHALLALIFGPVRMPELVNLGAFALLLALPFGIAALTAAWRMPTLGVASAAAVSTWFSALPYDSFMRGPLWPYLAGVIMIPAVLAMARYLIVPRGMAGIVGVSVGIVGLVGLHTSMFFLIATYLLLLLIALALRLEPIDWSASRWHVGGAAALSAVLALLWIVPILGGNTGEGVTSFVWPSEATVAGGFGQMITFSPDAAYPQWWVGIPAIVGIFLLIKHRRMLWMVGAYLVFGGLYAATVSMESDLIHTLTGPFYNDHWRIAALIPLAGAVAFGEFTSSMGEAIGGHIHRWRPAWSQTTAATMSVVLIGAILGLLGNGAYIGRNSSRLASTYQDHNTVSDGERAAYQWLAGHVGEGQRVMNGVFDGSVWMYALSGVKPVVWHFGPVGDGPTALLTHRLDEIGEHGPVRVALDKLDVQYVIVGDGLIRSWNERARGLRELRSNSNFHIVYRNADAVIYRIEGQQHVTTSSVDGTAHGTPG